MLFNLNKNTTNRFSFFILLQLRCANFTSNQTAISNAKILKVSGNLSLFPLLGMKIAFFLNKKFCTNSQSRFPSRRFVAQNKNYKNMLDAIFSTRGSSKLVQFTISMLPFSFLIFILKNKLLFQFLRRYSNSYSPNPSAPSQKPSTLQRKLSSNARVYQRQALWACT